MNGQITMLEQIQSTAIDLGLRFGPRVLVAGLIMLAGYYVGNWAARAMERMLDKLELEPPVVQLLVRLVRLLVLGLFLVLALQNLGVELLPLVAGLGVAGAGVALAMQGVLSNLMAGLTIIFTRPFKVGEYIDIVGEEGTVEAINLFNTTLSHPDLSRIVIPNRKLVGEILHNHGHIRQLDVTVGVAYDTDLSQALATVQAVLNNNPRVLQDPEPVIRVSALADSSVNLSIMPWVHVPDYGAVTGEVNRAVLEAFRAQGVAIPLPQREVRLLGQSG